MDLSKLLKMDLFKLLHGFVKVVPCFSRPLSNNIKLKFDHDVKACYKYNLEMFFFCSDAFMVQHSGAAQLCGIGSLRHKQTAAVNGLQYCA